MNHGLVFQLVEPRCLSDKLSAVNIERRCGGESRREGSEAAPAGRREVGAIPGSCKEQLTSPPFSRAFFHAYGKIKAFPPPSPFPPTPKSL